MTKNLNFSQALELIKQGKKIARTGWNGKCMFIFLTAGNTYTARAGTPSAKIFGDRANITNLPHIDFKTATGEVCIGWLASQSDILANDWMVVE